MSASKKSVGDVVDIKDRTDVEFPDGFVRTVSGDQLVLDQAGTYVIDGNKVQVKAESSAPPSGSAETSPAQP